MTRYAPVGKQTTAAFSRDEAEFNYLVIGRPDEFMLCWSVAEAQEKLVLGTLIFGGRE